MLIDAHDNRKILENTIKTKIFFENNPSFLLNKLKSDGLLSYIPELSALASCPQDPIYHPEGDVWTHTMMVVDIAAELSKYLDNDNKRKSLILSALLHDIAKPFTLTFEKNKFRAIMHEFVATKIIKILLEKLKFNESIINSCISLVKFHLIPASFYKDKVHIKKKNILNVMQKVDFELLLLLAEADMRGKGNIKVNETPKEIIWIRNIINNF